MLNWRIATHNKLYFTQMNQVIRVLFVGNSYTTRNDMPKMLTELACASGERICIEVEIVAFGGASLAAHWNRGEAQKHLAENQWDVVVLQDQSTRPIRALKSMQEHVRLYVDSVRNAGAVPYLYMTWARKDSPESQENITQAYEELALETGAKLVPVGSIWEQVRKLRSDLELFDPDGSHPSTVGSYLSACSHLISIFNIKPDDSAVGNGELDSMDKTFIHQQCWQIANRDITFRSTPTLRADQL